MTIKKHAKYGASHSHRWLACPGSIKLSEKAPPQPESKYAAEGTRAHECLEKFLKATPKQLVQKADQFVAIYGQEIVNHAADAAERILAMQQAREGSFLIAEQKVDASPFTAPDQFGTLDFAIIQPFGTLCIGDFKYGAGVAVDVVDNPQLIYYALAVAHEYDFNFTEVELMVIQPRAHHQDGPVRMHVMSMRELEAWAVRFQDGVDNCETKNPELIAGDHCHWCPAAAICPEISKKALAQAKIDFAPESDMFITLRDVPGKGVIQPIKNLSAILTVMDRLETWISAVRGHAFNVLDAGGEVPGFKLVPKEARRKWADEAKATKAFAKFPKAFSKPELLSPAQVEKELKDFNIKPIVAKHTVKVSSGLKLVAESDRREKTSRVKIDFMD